MPPIQEVPKNFHHHINQSNKGFQKISIKSTKINETIENHKQKITHLKMYCLVVLVVCGCLLLPFNIYRLNLNNN